MEEKEDSLNNNKIKFKMLKDNGIKPKMPIRNGCKKVVNARLPAKKIIKTLIIKSQLKIYLSLIWIIIYLIRLNQLLSSSRGFYNSFSFVIDFSLFCAHCNEFGPWGSYLDIY